MPDPRIRRIRPDDVEAAVGLAYALADYERAPDDCHLTAEQLHEALFGDAPKLFGHVAELDGEVVGFAVWFLNYSTWRGVHGIYLEDLFVLPAHRGSGPGQGAPGGAGGRVRRERLRAARVVGAGLEPGDGVLQGPRRGADGRVDGQPPHRRAAAGAGRAGRNST